MNELPNSERERLKRFYKKAHAGPVGDGFVVMLDGRPLKTPARTDLLVPVQGLAKAIVGEWEAQGDWIEHETMPLTKLANTALDRAEQARDEIIDDIVKFAGSDLICYLAEEPQELTMRQMAQWGPIIDWAAQGLGARFEVVMGVNHVEQPPQSLERIRSAIEDFDAFSLTALHAMTSLTGSALLTLALVAGLFDLFMVWQSAHLDEDFQNAKWGADAEAKADRERRWKEMQAADKLFKLMR